MTIIIEAKDIDSSMHTRRLKVKYTDIYVEGIIQMKTVIWCFVEYG